MSRAAWSVRSNLWLVMLIALGIGVAVNTWRNFQRGSAAYHRHLVAECELMSERDRRWVAQFEDELKSGTISDPAKVAEIRLMANESARSALSYDLQAAALAKKADLCERSPVGWLALQHQTAQNPPSIPVRRASVRGVQPWFERGSRAERVALSVGWFLVHLDYFGMLCLALAIVARVTVGRGKPNDGSAIPTPAG